MRRGAVLLALLVLAIATLAAQGRRSAQPRPRSRLFSPVDLSQLETPDREQWQKPDLIMDALGIADGSVVADLGAGGGWFSLQLARRVGPNGRVYAEDIQSSMIEAIRRRVMRENLTNVTPVLGTPSDPRLPSGLDAVLIVDTYHEIEDPVALLKAVAAALKPSGRLGIVDYSPGGGGPGPAADQRINPDAVKKAAQAAGLQFTMREDVPPFQFLLVFTRR
jgi:ubiquinone/menaquinone biosynthesis C-methylase UbiE